MKKYNPVSHCAKCKSQNATSDFVIWHLEPSVEVIRRICVRCGYKWFESPLDEEAQDDQMA